jgi:hypothetical protein
MADPREERLPKWAQEQARSYRMQVERLERLNAELRGEVGETGIHVQNYSGPDQPIRGDARVKFQLGGRFDQYVTVGTEGKALWLHGGRFLVIHPHVSNAFSVSMGE